MTMENIKALSPEQREELLSTLKARFEKNMNRHKNCGRSMKWKKQAVNQMLLVTTKTRGA